MEFRWLDNIEQFRSIAKRWDDALILSKEDNPFLLSNFILTWWKYFSRNFKLRIFIAYSYGDIVAGLPLWQNNRGYLEYPGGMTANYTEFLCRIDSKHFWHQFSESLKRLNEWRHIRLKRFRKNKLDFENLESTFAANSDILYDTIISDYTYLINIPEDFTGYLKYLPKKLRYGIKRSEKELSILGEIELYSLKTRNEVSAACDKYIELSRVSFRRRGQQSVFEDKIYCLFFKELINNFYNDGYLDANILKLDSQIIAIHLGYSMINNLNYIFTVFDINFAKFSPGHLLIYKLLELGSKRKNKLFDLYTGWNLYKEQWSNRKDEVVILDLRTNSLRGRIEKRLTQELSSSILLRKAKRFVNSSPRIKSLGRKVKKFVSNHI